jgi:hypothetical protein
MDLATDSMDKAIKLRDWISAPRVLRNEAFNAIIKGIEDDLLKIHSLQTEVKGLSSARTDIINGCNSWWHENPMGISNIFSVVSIRPRKCMHKGDILGAFSACSVASSLLRR